jgi:hypothetical protein
VHSRVDWGLIADIQPPEIDTKVANCARRRGRCARSLLVCRCCPMIGAPTTGGARTTVASRSVEFSESRIGFALRRPEGWRFERPAWSPAAEPLPLLQLDWSLRGSQPFLCVARERCVARLPRPALRVCCRPLASAAPHEVRRLLALQADLLLRELDEVEILASSFDAIVAGRRAAHVRYRYSLAVADGQRREVWRVMARSWLVLAPGMAYAISAASCAEERRFDEAAFGKMLASVRVDPLLELAPVSAHCGGARHAADLGPQPRF